MTTLKDFLLMDSDQIFNTFKAKAESLNLDYVCEDGLYLWVKGNTNIAVTAHTDTVDTDWMSLTNDDNLIPLQNKELKEIVENNGIITAFRDGCRTILGGDDRVGVHICYEQLNRVPEMIPHVLLFNGEEYGGIGSSAFCDNMFNMTMIHLMISVDCPYNNEFVWYGGNRCADKWVESFGWKNRGRGIFTDISTIGNHYTFPCVNLGCGYFNQHTIDEYIDIEIMEMCKRKIDRMIEKGFDKSIDYDYNDDYQLKYLDRYYGCDSYKNLFDDEDEYDYYLSKIN